MAQPPSRPAYPGGRPPIRAKSTARGVGKKAPVNDTKSYNNGVNVVPAFLLAPVIVTKTNAAAAYASDPALAALTK
jgi:hypothetical protein